RARLAGLALTMLYGLLLIAQVGAIMFTQSKGALAGLLAGLFFFGLLWAAARGYRVFFLAVVLAAFLATVLVVYIILPGTSLGALQDLPMLSRLTGALESRSFLSRTLIWDTVTRMITGRPGRLLVGYGPSTMDVTLQRYYTPALLKKRSATTVLDRAHSDLLDSAATAGLLGLGAYLLLFWALFHQVLRHLGLLTSRQQGRILSGLWFGLGMAAALGARLADGSWRFSGLAMGLGAVGGLVLYVTYRGLRDSGLGLADAESRQSLLPIGLAAGVVAHFVGGQFGIATPADRTYFWVFAALIAGLSASRTPSEGEWVGAGTSSLEVNPPRHSDGIMKYRVGVVGGLVTGFILMTLLNDFIWRKDRLEPSPVMLGLLGAVWLAGAVMFLGEVFITSPGSRTQSWSREMAAFVLASLPLPIIFLPLHITFIGPNRIPQEQPVVYLAMLLAVMVLLALALRLPGQDVDTSWRPDWAALYGLVVVAVTVVVIVVSITPLRASAFDKQGWSAAQDPSQVNLAVSMYQRAIELTPQWEQLYLRVGALLQGEAERLPAGTQQDAYYQAALQELEAALELRPSNAVHWINLGRFYVRRGNATSEPVSRRERLKRALEYYEHAATLRPASAELYREWGEVHAVLGSRDEALEKFTYAVTLDPDYVAGYRSLAQLYEIEEDWAGAVRVYRELVRLEPDSVDTSRALARAYWRAGELQSALAAYLQVLESEPRDYAAHRELVDLYQALGRSQTALAEARIAREIAPSKDQATLDDIIERLASSE
ncbi:MAG: tetratricopeptide repeat protein, partial [Anaerolineae bacterium]